MELKSCTFKKIISILLCVLMIISCLPMATLSVGAAAAAPVEDITVTIDTGEEVTLKDTDGNGYYEIVTANDLYAFSYALNDILWIDSYTKNNYEIYVELTADIIVNDREQIWNPGPETREWLPIDINFEYLLYPTFDGKGHTISGLYIDNESAEYIGLFGTVSNGTFKNLGIVNSTFKGGDHAGAIAGMSWDGGEIENCYVKDCRVEGTDNVGGFIGESQSINFINCHNIRTSVYNPSERDAYYSAIGGIVGYSFCDYFKNCSNTGNVTSYGNAGGIAGYNSTATDFYNCYNTGNIESYDNNAGGIIGSGEGFYISKCYNTGEIVTYSDYVCVGGLVGVMNSYGISDYHSINNCYNSGDIRIYSNPRLTSVGGVIGGISGSDYGVIQCYYPDNCLTIDDPNYPIKAVGGSSNFIDNTVAMPKESFESGEVAYLMGTDFGQDIDNGKTPQKSPVLGGARVFKVKNCDGTTAYSNYYEDFEHVFDTNHICENCGTTLDKAHTYNSKHLCTICTIAAETEAHIYNNDHICTICSTATSKTHTFTKDHVCTVCSATADEAHTFGSNHLCSVCYCLEEGHNCAIAGHTVSLGGKLGVNYYVALDESIASDDEAKVVFTVTDDSATYTVEQPINEVVTPSNFPNLSIITCNVAAKEITSVINCMVIVNGTETQLPAYSVKQYSESILANPDVYGDKAVDLVKAMLNYGATTQIYFGYNTEHLANDTQYMSDQDRVIPEYITFVGYEARIQTSNQKVFYYGSTLSLKSETAIKHYFRIPSYTNVENVKATVNGEKAELQKNGDLYVLTIDSIAAHNLNTVYEVKVGDIELSYSAFSYAYDAINQIDNQALKDTVRALYYYYFEAKQYLA